MSRARLWAWAKIIGGLMILALIGWRVGAGPFLDGVRAVDTWSVAVALGLGMITTVAAAWRWTSVARGLGAALALGPAVSAYYRAQFLNTVLPGGVLGDVDRGVRHGRDTGTVGRALRAVVWERSSGQAVQVAATVVVLLVLPSPFVLTVPMALVIMAAAVVGIGLLARVRVVRADLRVVLARRVWPRVLLASLVVVAGHAATYLVAARAVGSVASATQLVPLALLALVAMAVPLNVGGWGPREGVAAWSFAAVGLGADAGVATATAYGVLVFAASLPGAAVLALGWLRQRVPAPAPAPAPLELELVGSNRDG